MTASIRRGALSVCCLSSLVIILLGCNPGNTSGGGSINENHPPLRSTLDSPPYLQGADGVDVTSVVADGRTPYSCDFFHGDGEGTVPTQVTQDPNDPTGCTLIGDVSSEDATGSYGFLMEVSDEAGDSVIIPVFYSGSPCSTATVTLQDPESPPPVRDAGSAYDWTLQITDIDFPCDDTTCNMCHFCLDMHFNILDPLTGASGLACSEPGDVCSDCGDGCLPSSPFICPAVGTMNRVLNVKQHEPIREGPAWVTMELELLYTGDNLEGCSGKQWVCHIETLEI